MKIKANDFLLSLKDIRTHNFLKHNVIPGHQSKNIVQAARNLVGIHSARLPTPYVALHSRIEKFNTLNLCKELFVSKSLIKIRCMRTTLHIVPLDIAPIVHIATLEIRLSSCRRIFENFGINGSYIEEIKLKVIEIVKSGPKSSTEILNSVGSLLKVKNFDEYKNKIILRTIIKTLWEEGLLCYINTSNYWGSEERLYGFTTYFYPNLNLEDLDMREAQKRLIYFHINQYGPVTEKDIAWWSGLNLTTVRNCISDLDNKLIKVKIDRFSKSFFMTKKDFNLFQALNIRNHSWVALLAYEDPSLKGYFESRQRYVRSKYYHRLFNQIGEARPSIIVNGEVMGIWNWEKKKQKVSWHLFEKVDKSVHSRLLSAVQRLEGCLKV